jgi:molecular chaperone DnaK
MVKDAEAHAAEDKQKRELVETRNQAEALVHSTEKQLSENASNPAVAAVKGDIEKAIEAAKEVPWHVIASGQWWQPHSFCRPWS